MGLTILPVRTRSITAGTRCVKSKCAATIQTTQTREHSAMAFPQETFLMPSHEKTEVVVVEKNKKML